MNQEWLKKGETNGGTGSEKDRFNRGWYAGKSR
jgi:hypothetical protein